MTEPVRPGPPTVIGRYRILGRIGRGAMGMVYRAQDDALGRSVALKVLTPDLAAEPELRQRFFREARLAAQIQHRGVVSVLDVGEDQGRLYIVMELLEGATLDKHLRETPGITLEHKLDLMVQACEGLAVAHARGICHRDVKPANLFVQADGSVKLLDFGIAQARELDAHDGGAAGGDAGLHVAGAGPGRGSRSAQRRLLARRGVLLHAERPQAVRRIRPGGNAAPRRVRTA